MRYHALACDYDGTLAHDGRVDEATLEALRELRRSGRRLVLVTGRELDDLRRVFPELEIFERVVAENGALLYRPATREEKLLAPAPPPGFVEGLRGRGVAPISCGRSIVASCEPHQVAVLDTIRELGLELQVVFNKGSVMVLPSGVNKASGLGEALREMSLSPHNVVGVGDAENDHALLGFCECAVAVANALPTLKEHADLVTRADHGAGVAELVARILATDLRELAPVLGRHEIPLGVREDGSEARLAPYGTSLLVAGGARSGFVTGLLERLGERGYQYCIVDPGGDHADFEGAVVLGDRAHVPGAGEVIDLLESSRRNVVVNLLGAASEDRRALFEELLPRLLELRARTGRPHWMVLEASDQLLPSGAGERLHELILVTAHPDRIAPSVLAPVDLVVALGTSAMEAIRVFAHTLREVPPGGALPEPAAGEAIAWERRSGGPPFRLRKG